jgi:hypothetical protein
MDLSHNSLIFYQDPIGVCRLEEIFFQYAIQTA